MKDTVSRRALLARALCTSAATLALALAGCRFGGAGGADGVPRFDLQGHRGARALWPENSIPGFLGALDLGVTTLELDVVVSADRRVVVSHEPWFSSAFSTTPNGTRVAKETERKHAIFALPYAEVRRYDVGRRGNPAFPRQQALATFKPTLDEVFTASDRHARAVGRALPRYNVELKSNPEWDGRLTPPPAEFVALVLAVIERSDAAARTNIQSFDPRILREVRRAAPSMPLAYLVGGSEPRDVDRDLAELGLRPDVYSPAHELVDAKLIRRCHELGMRVIPWTVNEPARMRELMALGVDGLITDTPDLALPLFR